MIFYAKSHPFMTLDEHTKMVEKKYDDLLEMKELYFGSDEIKMIKIVCHYHDIGKINKIFQEKLKGISNKDQKPHGYLSVLLLNYKDLSEILNENKRNFEIVLNAIYFHHKRENENNDDIKEFGRNNLQENANSYFGKEVILKFINLHKVYNKEKGFMDNDFWYQYVIVKGILNKCGWCASASIDEEIPVEVKGEESINNKIAERFHSLKPLQQFMKDHCNDNVALIASTGGGKTEGALLWLNEEKGFFTLPMKVSANSIFERIKEFYLSNVAILHSDCFRFYEDENKINLDEIEQAEHDKLINYQIAKNLSYPLTVCTIDQIFKFAYKILGTEHILATMRYSKVIVDELQSYSPELLATIIYGLQLIHKIGGKFAIITATLPKFVLEDLKECHVQFQSFQHDIPDRHKIEIIDKDLKEDVERIKEVSKHKKVLIICNTVAKAQEIYQMFQDNKTNVYLLHSRFLKKDRELIERKVINFSNGNENGICISTQIVEASLDIDFDVLYTYMSSVDSLIQRMGRIYRNRRNDSHETNIYIYTKRDGIGGVYDPEIFEESLQAIRKYNHQIFLEEEKLKCIDEVYDIKGIKELNYYKRYRKKLENLKRTRPMEYDSKDADDKFRDIHSVKLIPDIILNKHLDEIMQIVDELKEGKNKNKLVFALDEYCINYNLYKPIYKYEYIDHQSFVEGAQIYLTHCLYDFDEFLLQGQGLIIDKKQDDEQFV